MDTIHKKVAIVGSHQVGKTTMVNDIYSQVKDKGVQIIDEQSKAWIDQFSFDWTKSDPKHYIYFQRSLYNYFNFALRLPVSFISDRTHIDVLAYTKLVCNQVDYESMYYNEFLKKDFKFLCRDIKFYFYLGYVDENGKVIEDYLNRRMDRLTDKGGHVIRFRRNDYGMIKDEIINQFL